MSCMAGLMVCKCYADEQKLRPTCWYGRLFPRCWVWCGFPILSFIYLLFFVFWKVTTTRYLELSHIYWVPQQKRPPLDSSSWVPLFSFPFVVQFFFLLHTADSRKERKRNNMVVFRHMRSLFSPWSAAHPSNLFFLPLPLVLSFSFNLTDTQCSLVSLSMCTYTGLSVYTHSLIMGQDSTHTHTYNIQWCCCCCFCFDWPACCWLVVRVRASAAHETQRLSCGFHMQHKKKRKQDAQIIIMIIIIIIMEREREGLWSTFSLFFFYFGSFWSCFFLWWSNSVAARE